jgi:endonuclease/exonuclease/phosphatase family metal-dependent hydrolase
MEARLTVVDELPRDVAPEPRDAPGPETPVPFRVVSWNMNHWRQPTRPIDTRAAAYAFLREELTPDVALLQETVPPQATEGTVVYREIADYRPWGSAIVARVGLPLQPVWAVPTRFSRRRFQLGNTFPGSVAIGEIAMDDVAPITVVSVYNVIDVYAQTTLLRIVADLIPLFDSAKGSRVILAGDLNVSMTTQDPYYLRRGAGVLGALSALGLVEVAQVARHRPDSWIDCPCGANGACRHVRTWQSHELDHAYVTESLRDEVESLTVRHDAVERGLSDHAPLVVDLALSRNPTVRQWDRDTAPPEIARLQGPEAGHVVDQLIGWAEDKERRVAEADRKGVILTRLPCSKAVVPEMWFQIDYPGERLPMYTVSIKGTGRVVVQFQWMLYPPFDTADGRATLLKQLNEIDGVEIGAERLQGRPDFPLAVLEDPASFEKFIGVLEWIVDKSIPTRSAVTAEGPGDDPGIGGG